MTIAKGLLDVIEACARAVSPLFQRFYQQRLFPLRDRLLVRH
jgi:hypothetical protein